MGLNTKTTSGVGTPWYIYAIIPAIVVAVMALLTTIAPTMIAHVPTWDYIVSSIVLAFGISVTAYQVQTGGDTNGLPYVIQVLALIIFISWAYAAN